MDKTHHFSVSYHQRLKADGSLTEGTPSDLVPTETLLKIYENMILSRHLSDKAVALQRTGKLGTFASPNGQEAVYASIGYAMNKEDIYVPYYRDHGVLVARDIAIHECFAYWGGDERGACYKHNKHDFPYCIPIGTQINQAAGVAFALKYKKQAQAVLTSCGDGTTSRGDFYEGLNIANAWQLPMVVVINNNQWAISVPRSSQTGAETLAQKGIAAGVFSIQVDGNDVIALFETISQALKRAREQHSPTLIEAITYRHADHTTSDDASRYEDASIREKAWQREPVSRLKTYLSEIGAWNEQFELALHEKCENTVQEQADQYLNMPSQEKTSMFDYLYETLPDALQEQRDDLNNLGANDE